MAGRNGSADWSGDLQSGKGTMTVGDGVFEGPYTFKSRFEEGQGTNPEQLIAAAHAGCFTMALSNMLAEAGTPVDRVHTTADIELRFVDGAPTITKIDLVTEGQVPGLDQATFEEQAQKAKEACLVSRALAGVKEMTVSAKLTS